MGFSRQVSETVGTTEGHNRGDQSSQVTSFREEEVMKDIRDEVDQVDVEGSRVDVTGRYRSVLGFPNFVLFHRVVRSYVLGLTVVGVTGCSTQPSTYEYHYKTDDVEKTSSLKWCRRGTMNGVLPTHASGRFVRRGLSLSSRLNNGA